MCMFCASAPVVLAAGAQLEAKQRRSRQEAITEGQEPPQSQLPALPAAMIIFVGLFIASALVHSQNWEA